jgi:SMI1 / KNR4 family (SUKH-1)
MAIEWPRMEDIRPSVDEPAVSRFEQRLGHLLPDDYRRFLLEMNGGRPDDSSCQYSLGVINEFFSLDDPDEDSDLESSNRWAADIPSRDLLYVGHDGIGGCILIALAGEHRGEVWLQDTEDPRPEGSNPRVLWHDRRDMKKLADSFEEFLRTLGPLKIAAQEG